MPNYQNGKIYMIWAGDERYYGSTVDTLCRRFGKHKSMNCRSSVLFDKYGVENCKIELVELFPCNSKEELLAREGYYIRNNECVNRCIAGRTKQEYYELHKERIDEWQKNYKKTNKEVLYKKASEKKICECGGKYTVRNLIQHTKSKKHQAFISK